MPAGVRRTALATLVTTFVALATAAVASAGNGGLLPGEAHSPNAHRIHQVFVFIAIFTGIILVLVEGALVTFMVKYRRRGRDRTAEGPQIHGSTRLEILWTVVPVVVLATIGTFLLIKLPGIANAPKAAAADETTVRIEGHQFYWMFKYPNGAVSINRLVAPADQVVIEDVVGLRWDVNHSWWVPDFGAKYDAIPGHTNKTWFKAPVGELRRPVRGALRDPARGDGRRRARRAARAVRPVHRHAQERGGPVRTRTRRSGQASVRAATASTHVYIGPALGGNPLLAQRSGLQSLLRNGQGQMPAVGKNWTGAQIDALDLLHEAVLEVDGRQRRGSSALPRRLASRTRHVVVDDGRPQAHRDPLHLDGARVLRDRRRARAHDAHPARNSPTSTS